MSRNRILLVFCLLLLLGSAAFPGSAFALPTTRYVSTTGSNSTNCSISGSPCATIAYAISQAAAGDTIDIAAGIYDQPGIVVDKDLTINGAGAGSTIVRAAATLAASSDRVFMINSGFTVTMADLSIRNGKAGTDGGGINNNGTLTLNNAVVSNNYGFVGGGINNNAGTLTLNNTTVSNSSANYGGGIYSVSGAIILNDSIISNNWTVSGGYGGGIQNNGPATLNSSTVSGNSSSSYGGGIATTGSGVILTLNNSTVSGNTATTNGGGISSGSFSTLMLNYGTVANNTANSSSGGGIYLSSNATANLKSSIVAGNGSSDCTNLGTLNSLGHNLTGSGTGCTISGTGDLTVAPANVFTTVLGPLAANGGSTLTHALLAGSPALDQITAGTNSCGSAPFDFDQRSLSRPQNSTCDIGAVESDATAPVVSAFTVPSPSTSLAVPITTFTASDAVGVTGYKITESATPPSAGDAGWTGSAPATYTVGSDGSYTLYPWAKDPSGNVSAVFGSPASVLVDTTPPTVSSSVRAGSDPSSAASVDFTVTFSELVLNVDPGDFSLTTTGVTGASIAGVSGSGATRTVGVNTGSGNGTIRLDLVDDDTIADAAGNLLGGSGAGNGSFNTGASYTISKTMSFVSTGAQDGWILESGETTNTGGSMNSALTTFQLGDDAQDRQYRAILSFNTAALPDNATVSSAILKIRQSGAPTGANPFSVLGKLWVDIRKPFFGTAATLQLTDFNLAATAAKVGSFTATPVGGWYSAALGAPGRNNINKTALTQLRLYFNLDDNNNNAANFMKFISGNAAGNKPLLEITFTIQ